MERLGKSECPKLRSATLLQITAAGSDTQSPGKVRGRLGLEHQSGFRDDLQRSFAQDFEWK